MNTLAFRVRFARKERGLTQVRLAELAGIEQSDLSKIETGKIQRPTFLLQLAKALRCDPFWLDTGMGEPFGNTSPAPQIKGVVPLLSSVQAGSYKEHIDNIHAGDGGMELIPTSVPINPHTFALRVAGDSMEPEFTEGMILIVEPEMDPHPGDYVIAKNGGDETTFKQLIKDGSDWYLKPLNPRYPLKPLGEASIIGVVRAVERRFR
jgi:SOS-response transcriptional repressor LexA